jgi:hypothetical protein
MIIGSEDRKVNDPRRRAGKELQHVNKFTDRIAQPLNAMREAAA